MNAVPHNWRFGINDPRLSGWIITVAYFVAFILCAEAGNYRHRRSNPGGSSRGSGLWFFFAVFLLFLGVNKQLDFQTLLKDVVRKLSTEQGWYESRRAVQAVFIVVFAVAGELVVGLIAWKLRGRWLEYSATPFGILFLISFIVFRAGLMEHFGAVFLHRAIFIPHRAYSIAELSCVTVAGAGAFLSLVKSGIEKRKDFRYDRE